MQNTEPRETGNLYKENWALLPTTGSFLFLFYLTSFLNKGMSNLNSNDMINIDFAAANFFAIIVSHFVTPAMRLAFGSETEKHYSEMVFSPEAKKATALLEVEFIVVTVSAWIMGLCDKPLFSSETNAEFGAQNFFIAATIYLTLRTLTTTAYNICTARTPANKTITAKNAVKENTHIMLQASGFILGLLAANSWIVPKASSDKTDPHTQILIGLAFAALPFVALFRAPIQSVADRIPWLQQVTTATGENRPLTDGDEYDTGYNGNGGRTRGRGQHHPGSEMASSRETPLYTSDDEGSGVAFVVD